MRFESLMKYNERFGCLTGSMKVSVLDVSVWWLPVLSLYWLFSEEKADWGIGY